MAMKKMFFVLALVFVLGIDMAAQRKDGFFNDFDNGPYNRIENPENVLNLPSGTLGSTNSEPAPLGNGLVILTALGLGYAIKKRKS